MKVDAENKRYITMTVTEQTKNHSGGNRQTDQDYSDVRMYEMKSNVLDPVYCYEFYVSKLHPGNPFLFQKPKRIFSVHDNLQKK